jgi:alpha-galactosidase
VVFSICEWGTSKPWLWAGNVGNLWRTTGDIHDCWDCKEQYWMGWTRILDQQDGLESFAGPGHWNDPDMLEVGNGGMSGTEYKSHFTLWCILAAPLIAGNDVRNMPSETKDILTNGELIAVDQDILGAQGRRVRKKGNQDVWVKPLKDGSRAVALLNRGSAEEEITVTWEELGFPGGLSVSVRDLWAKKNLGKFTGKFTAPVPSHGVVAVKVSP